MDIRIRLDFSYDGSAFHGYAYQNGLRTVQGQLQNALKILFQKDIVLTVAGRTDAGVHAKHQVAHFDINPIQLFKMCRINIKDFLEQSDKKNVFFTKSFFERQEYLSILSDNNENNVKNELISILGLNSKFYEEIIGNIKENMSESEYFISDSYAKNDISKIDDIFLLKVLLYALSNLKTRLNNVLAMLDKSRLLHGQENKPKSDIAVFKTNVVPNEFDARFSALYRRYVYTIADKHSFRDIFRRNYVLWHDVELDTDLMNAATEKMLGEHDFLSYCKPREGATTVRTLKTLKVNRNSLGEIEVLVEADAFCHSMVRSIVGVLLSIGQGSKKPCWGRYLLDNPSRSHGVSIAPAHGLALVEVGYPSVDLLGKQAEIAKVKRVLTRDLSKNCCD